MPWEMPPGERFAGLYNLSLSGFMRWTVPISEYLAGVRKYVGHSLLLMPGVAGIIRNDKGQILLQLRTDDGLWGLPAGSVDPGEAPAQALVREVHEETGLLVRPTKLIGLFGGADGFRHTYPSGDIVEYMVALFACEIVGGQLQIGDDESLELKFFSLDEMPKLKKNFPPEIFAHANGAETLFQWNEAWLADL